MASRRRNPSINTFAKIQQTKAYSDTPNRSNNSSARSIDSTINVPSDVQLVDDTHEAGLGDQKSNLNGFEPGKPSEVSKTRPTRRTRNKSSIIIDVEKEFSSTRNTYSFSSSPCILLSPSSSSSPATSIDLEEYENHISTRNDVIDIDEKSISSQKITESDSSKNNNIKNASTSNANNNTNDSISTRTSRSDDTQSTSKSNSNDTNKSNDIQDDGTSPVFASTGVEDIIVVHSKHPEQGAEQEAILEKGKVGQKTKQSALDQSNPLPSSSPIPIDPLPIDDTFSSFTSANSSATTSITKKINFKCPNTESSVVDGNNDIDILEPSSELESFEELAVLAPDAKKRKKLQPKTTRKRQRKKAVEHNEDDSGGKNNINGDNGDNMVEVTSSNLDVVTITEASSSSSVEKPKSSGRKTPRQARQKKDLNKNDSSNQSNNDNPNLGHNTDSNLTHNNANPNHNNSDLDHNNPPQDSPAPNPKSPSPDINIAEEIGNGTRRMLFSWQNIILKYSAKEMTENIDVVDLMTGNVEENYGHLESLEDAPQEDYLFYACGEVPDEYIIEEGESKYEGENENENGNERNIEEEEEDENIYDECEEGAVIGTDTQPPAAASNDQIGTLCPEIFFDDTDPIPNFPARDKFTSNKSAQQPEASNALAYIPMYKDFVNFAMQRQQELQQPGKDQKEEVQKETSQKEEGQEQQQQQRRQEGLLGAEEGAISAQGKGDLEFQMLQAMSEFCASRMPKVLGKNKNLEQNTNSEQQSGFVGMDGRDDENQDAVEVVHDNGNDGNDQVDETDEDAQIEDDEIDTDEDDEQIIHEASQCVSDTIDTTNTTSSSSNPIPSNNKRFVSYKQKAHIEGTFDQPSGFMTSSSTRRDVNFWLSRCGKKVGDAVQAEKENEEKILGAAMFLEQQFYFNEIGCSDITSWDY